MITLKKWTHPTTGQVRLYANGEGTEGKITNKVWVEESNGSAVVLGKTINLKGYHTRSEQDYLDIKLENDVWEVRHLLVEIFGTSNVSFETVLSIAE